MVIAVFYSMPGQVSRPAPYELVSVAYGGQDAYSVHPDDYEQYRTMNYK